MDERPYAFPAGERGRLRLTGRNFLLQEVRAWDFGEALTKRPSHRILALFRGEKEEVLDLVIEPRTQAVALARCGGRGLRQ